MQSNKVKYIIDSVTLIHSVDSAGLLREIGSRAAKAGRVMDVLIEVNIGGEESKGGASPDGARELLHMASELKSVRARGLMTIPPIGRSEESFDRMKLLFEDMRSESAAGAGMDILSMGMSADYVSAVKYGSNIVRIGSGIFGSGK